MNNTKLDEVRLILKDPGRETHILGVTETWLYSNFKKQLVNIKGYEHERVDRGQRNLPVEKEGAGGVMIYIEKGIPYIRRKDLESDKLESIWIQLCPPKHPPHLICVAYRTQAYYLPRWMEECENQVSNAYIEGHQLTFMGYFNVDLLTDDNDKQTFSLRPDYK